MTSTVVPRTFAQSQPCRCHTYVPPRTCACQSLCQHMHVSADLGIRPAVPLACVALEISLGGADSLWYWIFQSMTMPRFNVNSDMLSFNNVSHFLCRGFKYIFISTFWWFWCCNECGGFRFCFLIFSNWDIEARSVFVYWSYAWEVLLVWWGHYFSSGFSVTFASVRCCCQWVPPALLSLFAFPLFGLVWWGSQSLSFMHSLSAFFGACTLSDYKNFLQFQVCQYIKKFCVLVVFY